MANVLIGYSTCDVTREAFEAHGHNVWTCDLRDSESNHPKHLKGNIWHFVDDSWDFALMHPECTYMTVAAAWAFKDPDFERYPSCGYHQKIKEGTLTGEARREALHKSCDEVKRLLALPYTVVIENPSPSMMSRHVKGPHQTVQPYDFGDDVSKGTGLWTNNDQIPLLTQTEYVQPRIVNGKPRWSNQTDSGQNRLSPSDDRWLKRSKACPGLMSAIGDQYGAWLAKARKPALWRCLSGHCGQNLNHGVCYEAANYALADGRAQGAYSAT